MAKKPTAHNPDFMVDGYPYTDCREQHVWAFYDGAIDKKERRGYRVQQCINCTTKRKTVIDLSELGYGHVESRSYRYPSDYQVPGGLDSHDRGLLIAANFLAELAKAHKGGGEV